MECQTGPGDERLLTDQTVSFMDYNRSFSRGFHNPMDNGVTTTPSHMIAANPLCYLSGQFMDIKNFGGRPGVYPGTMPAAPNFYRAPFPEIPYPPLAAYPQTTLPPREPNLNNTHHHASPDTELHHIQALRTYKQSYNSDLTDKPRNDTAKYEVTPEHNIRRKSESPNPLIRQPQSPCSPPHSPSTPPPEDEIGDLGDSPSNKKYPDYCRTLVVKDANGGTKELVFPKALDLDRPKRARTTFSAEQLYHLEREFNRNQYLVGRERTDLAQQLHLSETQVKVWFQNRRTKYKRDKQREAEERHANAESIAACNILRILQPKHPSGGSTNHASMTSSTKDDVTLHHNPFLPPNLTAAPPSANHLLSLPRPPFYAP